MTLVHDLIGHNLSTFMRLPGGEPDDDQPRRQTRRLNRTEDRDPEIVWAVQLADNRKAVLVMNGDYQLLVCSTVFELQTFRGTQCVADALINMGIDNFKGAMEELPSVLENNIRRMLLRQLPLPIFDAVRAAS